MKSSDKVGLELNISPRNILRWVKDKHKLLSQSKEMILRKRKRLNGGGKKLRSFRENTIWII